MQGTGRRRGVALRAVSVALLALGLMLEGCGERQEGPLEPSVTESSGTMDQAVLRTDKERNAVDQGPATGSAQSTVGTRSVSAAGATATSIPFDPEPGPFANAVPSCDDCLFEGLPIGFSFTFFGNAYTAFNISTNGFLGFGSGLHPGCCAGGNIPSDDGINNIIAAAWTDLDTRSGGTVSYETRGRAPNRFLVVSYSSVPWYPEIGTNRVTTQIILYEGTNVIEIHTANQSSGHTYTQGVEDASGTQASFLPGRVSSNYGLTNDGVRFTTTAPWDLRAPLPTARRGFAVAGATGILYAIGGNNSAGTALNTVQAYNAGTNSWSTRAPLPAARQSGNGAATISGTIYVAGGQDAAGALTRTLYSYRTSTNTWSSKAIMPAFGGCGGSAVISGKLYVFSGCTRSSTGAQVASRLLHRYDPTTNTWATLASAPAVHFQPVVGSSGGKLYVVGGNNGAGTQTNRLDVYDPATNTWSTRAAMPSPRVAAAGVVAAGKLYVMGGRSGTTYLNTVEVYDPLANSWSARPAMPTARAALGVGVVSNLLYAIGGRNSASALATNQRFAP